MLQAMQQADSAQISVRGCTVFDCLHLAATRKAKATKFSMLNSSSVRAFDHSGDPVVVQP